MNYKSLILCRLVFVIFLLLNSISSYAAIDDLQFIQRASVTTSKGDLSKYPRHLSYQTALVKTYKSYAPAVQIEFAHEISFLYESFKTRGENTLLFPLLPDTQARILEPALSFEACVFSMSPVRLCGAAGLSLVHLQTTIRDYQMYAGIPAQLRLMWVSNESPWTLEIGARYRAIRNRIEGFVSSHEDTSIFLGFGYLKSYF